MFDERKYKLNAKLSSFKNKVEKSKKIIEEMMTKCKKPYIAWSGGKDSTALVYLITQEVGYNDILIFCEKDDCDFPDEKGYVQNLIQKYKLNCDIIEPEISMWNYIIQHKTDLDDDIHAKSNNITKKFFLECIKRFTDKHNPDGVFMGLRNQESKARFFNFIKKGAFYMTDYDNLYHCNPLSKWTVNDVFSYMIINDIPILPVYKKVSSIRQAEEIRKSWWIPSGLQIQRGYVLFLRKEYPELYQKLKRHFPKVASAC